MQKDLRIIFLALLNKGLRNSSEKLDPDLTAEEVVELFHMAEIHDILPVIFEALLYENAGRKLESAVKKEWQEKALQTAVREIVQTNEFLTLMLHLQEQGIHPLVLKGYICRSLWPSPWLRPSVDEDIYVSKADALSAHRLLLSEGLFCDDEDPQPDTEDETSYHKKDSPTYIELHTSLFPRDSEVYGDCNRFFEKIDEEYMEVEAEDVTLRTLKPTEHFLYLVLHVYKHFLHSGFGIRQICDMVLFAEKYGKPERPDGLNTDDKTAENSLSEESNRYEAINWDYLYECCTSQKVVKFTAALLKIGIKYFEFDMDKAGLTDVWKKEIKAVDEQPLLNDIMEAGLHGASDLNRIHSSNMTLEAVKEERAREAKGEGTSEEKGKSGRSSLKHILKTLFPPLKSMERRYSYVKKRPYLLPAAWASRIFTYGKESLKNRKLSSRKSLEIGKERTELLKEYGIIE